MKKMATPKSSHKQDEIDNNTSQTPTKISRVLAHLLNVGALNRFEAERIGDHCLHSTISDLTHGYGLIFKRIPEKVPNRWGAPSDVTRYSLPASQRRRAQMVLRMLIRKGRAAA